jgi:hypothetical protein
MPHRTSCSGNPVSLVAAESIMDLDQRTSPPLASKSLIQDVCQRDMDRNSVCFQSAADFASHQLDFNSCLLKGQKLKQ